MIPFDPVPHPLVRTMPYGREALYVGGHCVGVVGMAPARARRWSRSFTLTRRRTNTSFATDGDSTIW
jgi:hypothetical protein